MNNNGLNDRPRNDLAELSPAPPINGIVDAILGEQLASSAIARVEANASPDWKKRALDAVHSVARRKLTFTTDDVWTAIGHEDHAHDNRAMGAIMRQAARLQYCAVTETTEKTNRASNHRRPLAVWMSKLYTSA